MRRGVAMLIHLNNAEAVRGMRDLRKLREEMLGKFRCAINHARSLLRERVKRGCVLGELIYQKVRSPVDGRHALSVRFLGVNIAPSLQITVGRDVAYSGTFCTRIAKENMASTHVCNFALRELGNFR